MKCRDYGHKHAKIIINRPESISNKRRRAERAITSISWAFWVLLLRPILALLLWTVGVRWGFMEIFKDESMLVMETYFRYLVGVLGIYLTLQIWNRYNVMLFRGKERRTASRAVSDAEMASFYRIQEQEVRRLKEWGIVNIHFLQDNNLLFESDGIDSPHAIKTGKVS